jgi:hypothetical protein
MVCLLWCEAATDRGVVSRRRSGGERNEEKRNEKREKRGRNLTPGPFPKGKGKFRSMPLFSLISLFSFLFSIFSSLPLSLLTSLSSLHSPYAGAVEKR